MIGTGIRNKPQFVDQFELVLVVVLENAAYSVHLRNLSSTVDNLCFPCDFPCHLAQREILTSQLPGNTGKSGMRSYTALDLVHYTPLLVSSRLLSTLGDTLHYSMTYRSHSKMSLPQNKMSSSAHRMRMGYLLNDPAPTVSASSSNSQAGPSSPVRYNVQSGRGRSSGSTAESVGTPRTIMQPTPARANKTFECRFCSRVFGSKSNLKRHESCVHMKVKPFKCTICDSYFGLKQNRDTHYTVVHAGEKPFHCKYCGERFGYKQVLHGHISSKHKEEVSREGDSR